MAEAALTVVLPWLPAADLAHLACTCSALARAVSSVTRLRLSDIARGIEAFPIPIINTVDTCLYPPFFFFAPACSLPPPRFSQPWGLLRPASLPHVSTSTSIFGSVCASFRNECSHGETILNSEKSAWPADIARQSVPKKQRNCRCEGSENSLCGRTLQGELAYDRCARLRVVDEGIHSEDLRDVEPSARTDTISILECGAKCSCNLDCKYRVTQKGLGVKVAVVKYPLKGWGLRAAQNIAKGSFVCEYAGELLTTKEAQIRQSSYDSHRRNDQKFVSALLVVREHLPSGRSCLRLNIDATRLGNVARFLNHACDGGNLLPCLVRSTGSVIPKLALFARKNIDLEEELTFSYGDAHEGLQARLCLCGTTNCKGVMPSEEI